jgi:hypothetical protein
MGRHFKIELANKQLLIGVQLDVAAEDQGSSFRGWEVNIEHLDGGKLVEHRPRRRAARQRPEVAVERAAEAGDLRITSMSTSRDAALALSRAALSFITSSSRFWRMAEFLESHHLPAGGNGFQLPPLVVGGLTVGANPEDRCRRTS